MAPSFDHLPEEEDFNSDEEIDFSDLRAQHEVRMEQGLDAFVVVDGLPVVAEEQKSKLVKFLIKKLNSAGQTRDDAVFMPMNESGMSEGFAFVEYDTPDQANAAIRALHGTALDKRHTIAVNKITDIERYGREGRIDDEYHAPEIEPFTEKEHLRWWLADESARDQFVMFRGDDVGVFWNRKKEPADQVVDRKHWTEMFVQWSPKGTYLATTHRKGVQLWAGKSWSRQSRFPHPLCNMIDFSPNEKYICTWSFKPIEVEEGDPILSLNEDGKNYIIWEVATGKPLRSFQTHDVGPSVDAEGNPIKKRIPWPAFKWSSDDKYVARMKEGESISIYELPKMTLMKPDPSDKARYTIKADGIREFEWAPATPQREGIKQYEQLLAYWTPELGSNPAKVALMSIPQLGDPVRTRNLFNVSDAKLHWQSQGAFLCVKVDRHSKSKKSNATNLEIFRVREKGVPVEVVDSVKDTVINFAWEPEGNRFVLISTPESIITTAVPPKTSVCFYCPEKVKGNLPGNFKLIRMIEKKNSNGIYWCPKGRFVVVATVASSQSFDIDFWDLDFEGEKQEADKDLTANLALMSTGDHYGVTDVDWDPTGRYVVTSSSMFKQQIEHGYHLYDFKGDLLREEHVEKMKQFAWRPRPATLLSKEEQKTVRRNLREYSKDFEEEDRIADDKEKGAVVEQRRSMLGEWYAWLEREQEELRADRRAAGLPEEVEEEEYDESAGELQEIKEEVEEIVEETEEIVN